VDAIGAIQTETTTSPGQSSSATIAVIAITNKANTCGLVEGHHNPPNATSLDIVVSMPGSNFTPGTYNVGGASTSSSFASYSTTNASCAVGTTSQSTSGTVTFSNITSTLLMGTFDLTMAGGDHITGSFAAPICAIPTTTQGPPVACGS
jgi:hypothetical protein